MYVKNIKASNFKTFKSISVEFGKVCYLIGENSSGKSNFIQILTFIRDIQESGLENAIQMQGGIEYIKNLSLPKSEPTSISITLSLEDDDSDMVFINRKFASKFKGREFTYSFSLNEYGQSFKVINDELVYRGYIQEEQNKSEVVLRFKRGPKNTVSTNIKNESSLDIKPRDLFPTFILRSDKRGLMFETLRVFGVADFVSGFAVYDFDPKLPKKATRITGKAELEEDGSNLSLAISKINKSSKDKKEFFALIRDLLPNVAELDIEQLADKSMIFKLREKFSKKFLPASLLSDGTVNIVALITALYFERKEIIVIEEPERNLHPYLISRIVSMIEEVSKRKQIIITTHNPELINHADINNVYFIYRDNSGYSEITKIIDKHKIIKFLENDIGLEELFIQNILKDIQ